MLEYFIMKTGEFTNKVTEILDELKINLILPSSLQLEN